MARTKGACVELNVIENFISQRRTSGEELFCGGIGPLKLSLIK